MTLGLFTLTSRLHDANEVAKNSNEFLTAIEAELGCAFTVYGADYEQYGNADVDLIYVRTGGTEGIFRSEIPYTRRNKTILLTSGKSNSLAASMEILSFLKLQGRDGEIIHGSSEYIAGRINTLGKVAQARKALHGANYGIVGEPSDWLIASRARAAVVQTKLGMNLVEIPITEMIKQANALKDDKSKCAVLNAFKGKFYGLNDTDDEGIAASMDCSIRIYEALKSFVRKHNLKGLTLRCFDLLTALEGTGCLALAMLNTEGIIGSCEGDVPAMLTMAVAQALTGRPSFQANPSQINPETQEVLFAHCTVPLNMVSEYKYDTHFESGIGVAIKGHIPEGDVTVFKLSGDLSRYFVAEGKLVCNPDQKNLCRTQVLLKLDEECLTYPQSKNVRTPSDYFLTDPIGNHHIIIRGRHKALIQAFFKEI
ncbi:MAG: hypothetical protein ACI3ZQ_01035 [Candidatus Cryptobacteroides sp.]